MGNRWACDEGTIALVIIQDRPSLRLHSTSRPSSRPCAFRIEIENRLSRLIWAVHAAPRTGAAYRVRQSILQSRSAVAASDAPHNRDQIECGH